MAEYYDALQSAVTNLKSADRRSRQAFYERARRLVLERLQTAEPPMAAEEVRAEMTAFDAAIRQIETELLPPVHSAPPPHPAAPPAHPAPRAQPVPQPHPAAPSPAPMRARPARRAPAGPTPPPVRADQAVHPATPGAMPTGEARFAATGKLPLPAILIGAVAVAVLAVIAYALWPGAAPAPRADRAPPVAAKPDVAPASKAEPAPASNADNLPYILRRQLVFYRTVQTPGTVVISKSQHFLYVVRPNSSAMRYTVAAGPDCLDLTGLYPVSRKDSGADTALSLGDEKCRIRPTDAPGVIGQNTRTPGFQLAREDFADLFDHTDVDTRVVVTN